MEKDSIQTTVRLPIALFLRLNELLPNGERRDFIRKAITEKIARDFGETISPVLTHGKQGRRTDLERLRAMREGAELRTETAENQFHKSKTEQELTKKMNIAATNAVLAVNLILREAEILAAENQAVAAALAAYREAKNLQELESCWVALGEAVNAAKTA